MQSNETLSTHRSPCLETSECMSSKSALAFLPQLKYSTKIGCPCNWPDNTGWKASLCLGRSGCPNKPFFDYSSQISSSLGLNTTGMMCPTADQRWPIWLGYQTPDRQVCSYLCSSWVSNSFLWPHDIQHLYFHPQFTTGAFAPFEFQSPKLWCSQRLEHDLW